MQLLRNCDYAKKKSESLLFLMLVASVGVNINSTEINELTAARQRVILITEMHPFTILSLSNELNNKYLWYSL